MIGVAQLIIEDLGSLVRIKIMQYGKMIARADIDVSEEPMLFEVVQVNEDRRFTGLGTFLMKSVIKYVEHVQKDIYLWVLPNPEINLIKWYEGYGFELVGSNMMLRKYSNAHNKVDR